MATPPARSDLWLRGFRAAPPGATRLVCLPHAGGAASFFHPLAAQLGDTVEVLGVQYPGRQDRLGEPVPTTIDALVEALAAALTPWADRPLVFFGHSMGAIVGYELARHLEHQRGTPPLGLIVSGRTAPSQPPPPAAHPRDDRALLAEIRELNATDTRLLAQQDVLRMIWPPLRADYRAIAAYRQRPGPEPSCPVSVLVGDADARVPVPGADAWRAHTTGPCTLRTFPGGHFFLSEQWAATARAVREDLAAFHTTSSRHTGRGEAG